MKKNNNERLENLKRINMIILTVIILGPLILFGSCFSFGNLGNAIPDNTSYSFLGGIFSQVSFLLALLIPIYIIYLIVNGINQKGKNSVGLRKFFLISLILIALLFFVALFFFLSNKLGYAFFLIIIYLVALFLIKKIIDY